VADIGGALTYGGYRAAALATRALPGPAARALAPSLGFTANLASGERREMIARHLCRVDPGLHGIRLRRAVQATFEYYARYWVESFRLPHLSAREVERNMAHDGYDHVTAGLAAGRGVILALPHLGGWEWAGRWLVDRGHGVTVVVEQIEPPELFDWFVDLRSALGMRVVALGADAGKEVIAGLKRNDIVCLLCDRDIARSGVTVDFFGEPTTLPAGPVTIALRTGAPILPTAVYFTERGNGHFGWVRPPLALTRGAGSLRDDVAAGTQALARELEVLIRRSPRQWHLFQPNWPSDPGY
jgi:phosphatidylinositol dimannoside acyltransferase